MVALNNISTTWANAAILLAVVLVSRWVYWQLTTGTKRRRMIRKNACLPPVHYKHKGILGKLLGLDAMRLAQEDVRLGQAHERQRIRSFTDQKTLQRTVLQFEVIVTCEPENVKTILATKFGDYSTGALRTKVMGPVFGVGIFTADGHTWERSRHMIRPSFTRQQVADLSFFERHVQHLINHIPKDGRTIDLQELFFNLTMDSATEFLFGQSTNTLVPEHEHKDAARFTSAFTYVSEEMAADFRTQRLNQLKPNKRRQEDSKFIRKFASDIVEEAKRSRDVEKGDLQKDYVLLYELLKVTDDVETLVSETLNILLAGRDTTANLLSHTFFQLARRPDIWQKLQTEIRDGLGDEIPTYETMKNLKYVRWVLNEALRLYPVVPGNSRMAIKDTVLPVGGGPDGKSSIFVPAGTPVTYSVYAMHRRKDLYGEDALEFVPERWENLRVGWEYLPFNGGPRICIGQNFALTEASYTLVRLIQHFKGIEARAERPWSGHQLLTMAVKDGVMVALHE